MRSASYAKRRTWSKFRLACFAVSRRRVRVRRSSFKCPGRLSSTSNGPSRWRLESSLLLFSGFFLCWSGVPNVPAALIFHYLFNFPGSCISQWLEAQVLGLAPPLVRDLSAMQVTCASVIDAAVSKRWWFFLQLPWLLRRLFHLRLAPVLLGGWSVCRRRWLLVYRLMLICMLEDLVELRNGWIKNEKFFIKIGKGDDRRRDETLAKYLKSGLFLVTPNECVGTVSVFLHNQTSFFVFFIQFNLLFSCKFNHWMGNVSEVSNNTPVVGCQP